MGIPSHYLRDEFIFDSSVVVEKLLVSWKVLVLQLRDGREAAKKDLEHPMFSCPALLYNKYHSKKLQTLWDIAEMFSYTDKSPAPSEIVILQPNPRRDHHSTELPAPK